MNVCLYGASSTQIADSYITATEKLGEALAAAGHSLVYGAGGSGLMGAVARGMTRGNGTIIGVVPSFFKVDGILYDGCTEVVFTDTMRERKQIMEERSDAFVVAPGGIGTYEEFFEIYTLKQLAVTMIACWRCFVIRWMRSLCRSLACTCALLPPRLRK